MLQQRMVGKPGLYSSSGTQSSMLAQCSTLHPQLLPPWCSCMQRGICPRGESCYMTHGMFEYYMHRE